MDLNFLIIMGVIIDKLFNTNNILGLKIGVKRQHSTKVLTHDSKFLSKQKINL